MTYDVGTRIDLRHLNQPQQVAQAAVPARPERGARLYETGTRILFIKVLQDMTEIKITPRTIAYLQPAGA